MERQQNIEAIKGLLEQADDNVVKLILEILKRL
jgi:hypothetical protein